MQNQYLFIILFFLWTGGFSQVAKTVEIADTTYSYEDADFELISAAAEGDTNKIKAFLDLGTDVNTTTWEGVTPLMFAAQNGHLRAVEIFIDEGADLNLKPYNQIDALMGASIAGHVHVADTLILNGANVNTRNIDGVTPLMYAAAYDHYILCDVLLFYGAKLNTTDNFGNLPIHFSIFYGNPEITRLFIEKGADKDVTDLEGYTPLMIAAQNGHLELVAYLIEAGCDMNKTNDYNCDALALAIISRQYEIAGHLLNQGADANHMITDRINQYELARETAGKTMTSLLENSGAQPLRKYSVNKLLINYEMNGNNKDIMLGGSVGLSEAVYGWVTEFGYRTRPWVRSVRYESDPQTQYQFWEKRSVIYLGAGKRLTLASPQPKEFFGLFVTVNAGYTYGSFRGSNRKPEDKLVFIPKAGLFYNYKALTMKLNYEYMKITNTNIPPHRITFTVGAIFNLIKTRYKMKKEPDL